jgi:predicted dehydrogenase
MASSIKRYAVVGTGGRAVMFIDPLVSRFQADGALVALCDVNPQRLEHHNARLVSLFQHPRVPT